MLYANFDENRRASVTGAWQYDTGQRLCMRGLPSPEELTERDDLLSGDSVSVIVHFSLRGDRRSEMRPAEWNEVEGVWMTDIPDSYLRRSMAVYIHVYVMYGMDAEENSRTKTMYEAVMTPMSRSAPDGEVTDEQKSEWESLLSQVRTALSGIETVISDANAAKTEAQEAAGIASAAADASAETIEAVRTQCDTAEEEANEAVRTANTAAESASAAVERWDSMRAEAVDAEPGTSPSAVITDDGGVKKIVFTLPRGARGADGAPGKCDIQFNVTADGVLEITTGG